MFGPKSVVENSVNLAMSSLQIEQQPSARVKRTDKHSKQCVQKVHKEKYGENNKWKRLRAIKKQHVSRDSFESVESVSLPNLCTFEKVIDPKWINFNEPGAPLGDGWLKTPVIRENGYHYCIYY